MKLNAATTEEGETVHVDDTRAVRGSEGPFYVVYASEKRELRWGFRCGNCGSFDNAMDTMGRIQCNACSNVRKPEEWDAAHE